MAHEHLLKAHIYLHTASGDTPILEYRRLRSHILKLVTSRRFQKWCSSGVVSAFLLCKTIDFTGFFRTFRDTAVADEKHSYHIKSSSYYIVVVFIDPLQGLYAILFGDTVALNSIIFIQRRFLMIYIGIDIAKDKMSIDQLSKLPSFSRKS